MHPPICLIIDISIDIYRDERETLEVRLLFLILNALGCGGLHFSLPGKRGFVACIIIAAKFLTIYLIVSWDPDKQPRLFKIIELSTL
jgi:hypothetical protein